MTAATKVKPTARPEPAYVPPYQYECTAGHTLGANHPEPACPVYVHGQPCPGQLVRFGPGSRSHHQADT